MACYLAVRAGAREPSAERQQQQNSLPHKRRRGGQTGAKYVQLGLRNSGPGEWVAQPRGASGSQEVTGKGPRVKVHRACGVLSMLSFLPPPGRRASKMLQSEAQGAGGPLVPRNRNAGRRKW